MPQILIFIAGLIVGGIKLFLGKAVYYEKI